MPFWHPQVTVSEWPQYSDRVLDDGPFILKFEERPVITIFWILEWLEGECSLSEGSLNHFQVWSPTGIPIQNRSDHNSHFCFLTVNEHVLMTSCQQNRHSKHLLLIEGQFQDIQRFKKCILPQWWLLNMDSRLTPCWFNHYHLFKVFDSCHCVCFHSPQIADRAHVLPMSGCEFYIKTALERTQSRLNDVHHSWFGVSHCRPLDYGSLNCWLEFPSNSVIGQSIICCNFMWIAISELKMLKNFIQMYG
jgi:hypothetical protein